MTRLRAAFAFVLFALILVAGPVALAQGEPTTEATTTSFVGEPPAVIVDSSPAAVPEDAWTFRFLVPMLLVVTGIAVVAVIAGYGLRIRGRYRVAR